MTRYMYTSPDIRTVTGSFRTAAEREAFCASPLSTAILGDGVYLDMEKAVHLLVAGKTGSGKSVMLHNILGSLLLRNTPNSAQFLIIDPKMVEFEFFYHDNPCLYCPIITEPKKAVDALADVVDEMMRRYDVNRQTGQRFWRGKKLYIIIDEIADLISEGGKRLERIIERIARLGRGAAIHLIVATQHPTKEVLSRQITTNIDTRICLKVRDGYASRIVLGHSGGEDLRGNGDAILQLNGTDMRFQGSYINDEELEAFSHSWVLERIEEPVEKTITVKASRNSFLNFLNRTKTA